MAKNRVRKFILSYLEPETDTVEGAFVYVLNVKTVKKCIPILNKALKDFQIVSLKPMGKVHYRDMFLI